MKKILHITPHLGGGAGKAVSGIITELKEFKNSVLMLEDPVNTKYYNICKDAGIALTVSSDMQEIQQKINMADIIVLNWWAHPLEVWMLQNVDFGSTPVILWSHINGLNYPYLIYDFLRYFDGLMFTSPCVYENPIWTEKERSEIISNSKIVYGTGKFHPEKFKCKLDYSHGNKIKICYSGTLDFSKMNKNFPKIIKQISEKYTNVEFYLYGDYSEKFKCDFLKESNCENVYFCGFSYNIETILAAMDIFCYPLTEETTATTENSLLEAMAAGLPVVVMDNPAERNIVDNGKTGFIVNSAEEFTQITLKLCREEDLRENIGKNARDSIIKKYSFNVILGSFRDCINNVKSRRSTSDFKDIIGNDLFDSFRFFCGLSKNDDAFDFCQKHDKFYRKNKSSPFQYLKYFPDNKSFLNLTAQLEQEHENGY